MNPSTFVPVSQNLFDTPAVGVAFKTIKMVIFAALRDKEEFLIPATVVAEVIPRVFIPLIDVPALRVPDWEVKFMPLPLESVQVVPPAVQSVGCNQMYAPRAAVIEVLFTPSAPFLLPNWYGRDAFTCLIIALRGLSTTDNLDVDFGCSGS
jgi:hypothetical protein